LALAHGECPAEVVHRKGGVGKALHDDRFHFEEEGVFEIRDEG
jgi:hypothetical protein